MFKLLLLWAIICCPFLLLQAKPKIEVLKLSGSLTQDLEIKKGLVDIGDLYIPHGVTLSILYPAKIEVKKAHQKKELLWRNAGNLVLNGKKNKPLIFNAKLRIVSESADTTFAFKNTHFLGTKISIPHKSYKAFSAEYCTFDSFKNGKKKTFVIMANKYSKSSMIFKECTFKNSCTFKIETDPNLYGNLKFEKCVFIDKCTIPLELLWSCYKSDFYLKNSSFSWRYKIKAEMPSLIKRSLYFFDKQIIMNLKSIHKIHKNIHYLYRSKPHRHFFYFQFIKNK